MVSLSVQYSLYLVLAGSACSGVSSRMEWWRRPKSWAALFSFSTRRTWNPTGTSVAPPRPYCQPSGVPIGYLLHFACGKGVSQGLRPWTQDLPEYGQPSPRPVHGRRWRGEKKPPEPEAVGWRGPTKGTEGDFRDQFPRESLGNLTQRG